jgi:anhydro-N-acetylmuramic acid kinase
VPELYIGLMSGTSLDGVDGVIAECTDANTRVIRHVHQPFPPALAAELLQLNNPDGLNELHRAALAGNALARLYAAVVTELLQGAALEPAAVTAIGAHGQTVRHRPGEFDTTGYTLQLNSPALLAELTGIDVVADFRSRDVAAGGQGAPLVPAFHQAMFAQAGRTVAALNIGGIANLSVLRDETVLGFDCGPGNALMVTVRQPASPRRGRWAAARSTRRCWWRCCRSPTLPCRRPRVRGAICSTRPGWQPDWPALHLSPPSTCRRH